MRQRVRQTGAELGGRLKFLVGKPGLDGHSNGAEQIAVRARDAGFEVIYSGIRLTPAQIVSAAVEEDVHVVGLSVLSGSHLSVVPEVLTGMRAAGLTDVPLVVGRHRARTPTPSGCASWAWPGCSRPKDFEMSRVLDQVVDAIREGARPVLDRCGWLSCPVRLVIARCSVDYVGRLTAHLPMAPRLLLVKADGSVLVHADGGSYKPLNWMSPPCRLVEADGLLDGHQQGRRAAAHHASTRCCTIRRTSSASIPGLVKDGVEAHLQVLLAQHIEKLGQGYRLVRREYPTAIGPVDILARDPPGVAVAVEIKRRGEIDGVEQLTRYLELLNRDPLLAPVTGVFAAQEIKPQARTLAADRGIDCLVLDYDELRGIDTSRRPAVLSAVRSSGV